MNVLNSKLRLNFTFFHFKKLNIIKIGILIILQHFTNILQIINTYIFFQNSHEEF